MGGSVYHQYREQMGSRQLPAVAIYRKAKSPRGGCWHRIAPNVTGGELGACSGQRGSGPRVGVRLDTEPLLFERLAGP